MAVAAANNNGCGCHNGCGNGCYNGCGYNTWNNQANSQFITGDTRTIAALSAELMKEKSERYADNNGISLYKELAAKINADNAAQDVKFAELVRAVAELDKRNAVDKKEIECNFAFLNNRITEEAKSIRCYVDATFVPGELKMPLQKVCPEAMRRYNTWAAPTGQAPDTQSNNVVVND